MAKTKLTEVQKFFIENNPDMPSKELASKLGDGIGVKTVENYRKSLSELKAEEKVPQPEQNQKLHSPKRIVNPSELMGIKKNKYNDKITDGVFMTESASTMIESEEEKNYIKQHAKQQIEESMSKKIHNPKGS